MQQEDALKHEAKALKNSGQQTVETLIESDASILDLTGTQVVNIDLPSSDHAPRVTPVWR